MKIVSCQVNHLNNPLGFELTKPVFSWKVESAAGKRQRAARILVSLNADLSAPLLDTGWQEALDSLATEVDVPLKPRTRYYWQAWVRTDAGEEAASEVQWFETAKMEEPWQAQWIGCADAPRHPVFFRQVEAMPRAVSARLYITGLGLYQADWNGVKIGDEVLTPYCNTYDRWIQYQTFDVTERVRQGGTLSVTLGNGWYKGRFGFGDRTGKGYYGDSYKLLAELRITLADGAERVMGTDGSWQRRDSAITFSNIYDGEHRDDTLPATAPVAAEVMDAPEGALTARYSLPVRCQREMPAQTLIHTPAGETVLDLGQEITGGFRLRVRAPRGVQVHLQFGEILQEGNFYRDNLRTARAEYWYTANGEETILEPTFTFYGYRYVKVEGVDDLKIEDFQGLCWWSEMKKTGCLETGHPLINRLIANAEWGHLDNFLDVPTDCPQRDERMGWTGDAQVFAPTACFQRDSYAFYRKYLHDMAQEQAKHEGMVPDVIPAFGVDSCACAWGDAATIIPWHLYQVYGDKRILEEQFDSMRAWADYVHRLEAQDHGWRKHFHYGDWLALDGFGSSADVKGGTDDGFLASVYAMISTELVGKAADVLGRAALAELYLRRARAIREFISQEYYSPLGRCCVNTQTAHLLTLRHRLGPDPLRSGEMLVKLFNDNGGRLATGFVGTPILAEELTRIGRTELAWRLLFNEDYPGWLYAVKLGATTIWERWNSLNPDGSVSSTGMNSLNHYSYGSIVRWIYERAGGLKQDEAVPGFRRAVIAPVVDWRLNRIRAEYDSPAGKWRSEWEIRGLRALTVKVTIPFGCTAKVILPFHDEPALELDAGSYEWTYATNAPLKKVYSTSMTVAELLAEPEVANFLMEKLPTITQLPPFMRDVPMAALLRKHEGEGAEASIQRLDEALERL